MVIELAIAAKSIEATTGGNKEEKSNAATIAGGATMATAGMEAAAGMAGGLAAAGMIGEFLKAYGITSDGQNMVAGADVSPNVTPGMDIDRGQGRGM